MSNVLITDNIFRNAGGFGYQERPDKNARHIQGGWISNSRTYPTDNFIIENNIFDRSVQLLISTGSTNIDDLPVFRNNTYIQYSGKLFGMYGVGIYSYYSFDNSVINTIRNILKDSNAIIYGISE